MLESRRCGRGDQACPRVPSGERLYQAKIYLETPELLAWTLVIILISMGFEKLFLCLLDTKSATGWNRLTVP